MKDKCSVHDCWRAPHGEGYCRRHWMLWLRNGVPERVRAINAGRTCKVDDCDEWARKSGYCIRHYARFHKYNRLEPLRHIRQHPLYITWNNCKNRGFIAPSWNDFWAFVSDVGERPSKNHYFMRLRDEPIGPGNWQWYEKLRRQPGETVKEFNARKWQSRRVHFPLYETNRYLLRRYGITLDQYRDKLTQQGGVCAICLAPETAVDAKINGIKSLAVDHCHKTKKVRGLLCFRCNSVIGKVEERADLLAKASAYLAEHNGS